MNILFLPLEPFIDLNSSYTVVNLLLTFLSLFFAVFLVTSNKVVIARPGFVMGVFFQIIFQCPLALYSSTFAFSLGRHWFFAISIHCIVLSLFIWTYFTRKLNISFSNDYQLNERKNRGFLFSFYLMASILSLLLITYFYFIPFQCTALYALIYEPYITLLAREISAKLSYSNIPFYANGALINIIIPVFAYQSFIFLYNYLGKRQYYMASFFIVLFLLTFPLLYITGAKGNFIPTLILLGIAFFFRFTKLSLMSGLLVSLFIITFGSGLMTYMEFLRGHSSEVNHKYNIGYCAKSMGVCSQVEELLISAKSREDSLGFDNRILPQLQSQVSTSCSSSVIAGAPETPAVEKASANPLVEDVPITKFGRLLSYLDGIVYRAVGVPLQVSSWHFKYVEEFGSPGKYEIPFAQKLFGKSESTSIKINQIYGSIYSRGARVATGTAPTTFLLAWPAYWGWYGLIIAIACILILDIINSLLLARLNGSYFQPISIGLIYINCINFLSSSFEIVLISHGGILSIMFIIIFNKLKRLN